MNTMNATAENIQTVSSANVTEENSRTATQGSNWMTSLAGVLFWGTVALQLYMWMNEIKDDEFVRSIFYNVLPITGALAYFGLRREVKAKAGHDSKTGGSTKDYN